jgi:acetoin utilization deacetylase AcuC-like enzyme
MEFGNTILETSKNLIAFKLWAIKHHMYVATIILVMDYCFNRNEPRAKERREEIMECFRAVKRNDNGATTMPPGLQKLEKILQIHKDSAMNLIEQPAANTVLTVHTATLLAGGNNFTDAMSQQPWIDFDFNSWDNTDFDSNLDTSLFDELFHNLESNNDLI